MANEQEFKCPYPNSEDWGLCPRCGEWMNVHFPALSRADNETSICSACGKDEGMMDASAALKMPSGPHRTVVPEWRKRFPDRYTKDSVATSVEMQYFCSPLFDADARRNLAMLEKLQQEQKENADDPGEEGVEA